MNKQNEFEKAQRVKLMAEYEALKDFLRERHSPLQCQHFELREVGGKILARGTVTASVNRKED